MPSVIGEVFVAVRPLTTGFSKELETQLKASLGTTGKALGSELEKNLSTATSGIPKAVAQNTGKIEEETGKWTGAFNKVRGSVGNLEKEVSGKFSGLAKSSGLFGTALKDLSGILGLSAGATLGLTVGVAAIAGLALSGVHHFVQLTDQVRNFKNISGASAETSSRFVAALNILGISSDSFGRAMFQLSKRISTGSVDLAQFGVEVAKTKDGSIDLVETTLRIADAFAKNSNDVARNNLAFQAFGRAGLALIPILARGREGLEELFKTADKNHEVFSDKDLEKGRQFKIATAELHHAFEGLEVSLGEKVIPFLTTMAHVGEILIHVIGSVISNVYVLSAALLVLASSNPVLAAIGVLSAVLVHMVGALEEGSDAAAVQAQNFETLFRATEDTQIATTSLAAAYDQLAIETDHLNGTSTAHIDYQKQIGDATEDLEHAKQKLAIAQQNQRDIMGAETIDTVALATATKEVTKVMGEAEKAAKDLAAAEKRLNDARDAAINASIQVGDLTVAVADDRAQLTEASENLTDAQDKLNKLTRTGGADLEKQAEATRSLRDAELRLQEARLGIADAAVNLREKQQALGKSIDEFGPQSIEAAKAQAELEHAQLGGQKAAVGVQDAQDQVTKAHKDLRDASAGSEASHKRLADAQRAVDQASRNLSGAYRTLAKASADLTAATDAAAGKQDTAAEKAANLRGEYEKLAGTLGKDSALRKSLEDTANAILTLSQATGIVLGFNAPGGGGPGQSVEDPFARGVARGTAGGISGNAVTINVYPSQGQSEAATAQQVSNNIAFHSGAS